MFCPRCGSEAVLADGALVLARAGWDMSVHVSEGLLAVYVAGEEPRTRRVTRGSNRWGGTWFCPGDGVQAVEADGMVSCPLCNRPMNQFLYELTEFHGPHPK